MWAADGQFYDIQSVDGNLITEHPVHVSPFLTEYTNVRIPWHITGTYKFRSTASELTTISRNDILGKALLCGSIITTWEPSWLMSKFDQ